MADDVRTAIAESVISAIKADDANHVEILLRSGTDEIWSDVLRYELRILSLMDGLLRYDIQIPKLAMYEISTLSPVHYAALNGNKDIMRQLLTMHIHVDTRLHNGTTPLHLACFAGQLSSVELLVDEFNANINCKDNYGWTPLHYASSEGHLVVIEYLVSHNADISERDRDGTTAAFRAQANGHIEAVSFFLQSIGAEDLLLIDDSIRDEDDDKINGDIYARIDKNIKPPVSVASSEQEENPYLMEFKGNTFEQPGMATNSVTSVVDETSVETTPHLRRQVQKGIEDLIQDLSVYSAYSSTSNPANQLTPQHDDSTVSEVNHDILRNIIREESRKLNLANLEGSRVNAPMRQGCEKKYRETYQEIRASGIYEDISTFAKNQPPSLKSQHHLSTEDPYMKIPIVPDEPPTSVPPVPPREQSRSFKAPHVEDQHQQPDFYSNVLLINRNETSKRILKSCFRYLSPKLDKNWKKLFRALMENGSCTSADMINTIIQTIENHYPKDIEKQALMSLMDWRFREGDKADMNSLKKGIRKCGLPLKLLEGMEKAAQEFDA